VTSELLAARSEELEEVLKEIKRTQRASEAQTKAERRKFKMARAESNAQLDMLAMELQTLTREKQAARAEADDLSLELQAQASRLKEQEVELHQASLRQAELEDSADRCKQMRAEIHDLTEELAQQRIMREESCCKEQAAVAHARLSKGESRESKQGLGGSARRCLFDSPMSFDVSPVSDASMRESDSVPRLSDVNGFCCSHDARGATVPQLLEEREAEREVSAQLRSQIAAKDEELRGQLQAARDCQLRQSAEILELRAHIRRSRADQHDAVPRPLGGDIQAKETNLQANVAAGAAEAAGVASTSAAVEGVKVRAQEKPPCGLVAQTVRAIEKRSQSTTPTGEQVNPLRWGSGDRRVATPQSAGAIGPTRRSLLHMVAPPLSEALPPASC
jgi:hypothetical protein